MKEDRGFSWVLVIIAVILIVAVAKVEHDAGKRSAAKAYWEGRDAGYEDARSETEQEIIDLRDAAEQAVEDSYNLGYEDGHREGYQEGYYSGYYDAEDGIEPNPEP